MQGGRVVTHPTVRVPHRHRLDPPFSLAQHGDLGEPATACPIARDVQQDLDCRGELAVQSSAVKAAERPQRFHACRDLTRVVGVYGARAALVTGIERRQQIHHLGSPNLTDHDAVGPHPQRLSDELTHGYLTDSFDVRTPRNQLDQMWMPRGQLGGILDAHDPLIGRHGAQHRCQQRCLPGTGSAAHEECQLYGNGGDGAPGTGGTLQAAVSGLVTALFGAPGQPGDTGQPG